VLWGLPGGLGFELGDAPVGESVVGACGLQPFFEGPVVLGELADALFERGVLGGDPLDGVLGEFVFGVTQLPKELPIWARWVRISAWAAFRASSALSARSRHNASAWESCSACSRCRWATCARAGNGRHPHGPRRPARRP
jgi:hypothetical protein